METERAILHCDCNCFFASVELLAYPALRDVPVAVCGSPDERHGIVLAKNEAAKRCGVQTAETIWSAKRKCPTLTLLPPHHEKYTHFSRIINAIYAQYTDRVEPFGIDESWLDITHTWQLFAESPVALANEIRQTVKAETGISISVGVSFNKVFAKLGSDYRKPDATTEISRENYKNIVWPLPVGDLLYVGKAAQSTLAELGVKNIGQLAAKDPALLTAALGKMGAELSRYARGEDDAPVRTADEKPEVKSIGNALTFKRNLVSDADLRAGVSALADEVASRLRRHGLYASAVQIAMKDVDLKSIQRQSRLAYPTHLAKEIGDAALVLIAENWNKNKPMRMLSITAIGLSDGQEAQQTSLFSAPRTENVKRENLEKSLDAIRRKYGKLAIAPGNVVQNDLGLDTIEMDQKISKK
ncbi:MAG: DNA polymerase IV [Ruthenibacterium sp.]